MARNTNRVASGIAYVVALGLAIGASAAHWDLRSFGSVTYATEVFGADADQELDLVTDDDTETMHDERTRVELVLVKPADDDTTTDREENKVSDNSEVVVTITLRGATFGNTVQINDFELSGVDNDPAVWEIVSGSKVGGRAGTGSVSVGIKAVGEGLDAGFNNVRDDSDSDNIIDADTFHDFALDTLPKVTLMIPAIEDANGLATAKAKVTVTASVDLEGTSGIATEDFPTEVVGPQVMDNPMTTDVDESINAETMMAAYSAPVGTIATSANALTFATSAAGAGSIDLPDRTVLALKAKTMQLAGLGVTEAETPPMTADLEPFSLESGGKADIVITVTGGIRSDDQVFFDLDRDSTMDEDEALDIDDGEATGDFRLDDNKDLPARVHYVPGGDDMSRTTFSTQFAVEFDSAAGAPKILPVVANLGYAGVNLEARAYAIPKPDIGDQGNVRVRCETSDMEGCHVYLECDDQDGMTHFGDAGEIARGATLHMSSQGVADVLGVDTWEGRLSCDVLSSDDASAQVLVRSGDSLVNNTYVDDL